MADPVLQPALAKLAEVRRLARRHYVRNGLAILVLAFGAWAASTYLLDRYIPNHLPAGVRLIFTAGGALAWALLAWRHLVYPLSVTLSDDDLALVVERTFPDLRDRLISALQLTERPEAHPDASPVLVRALVEEAAGRITNLDFRRALVPRAVLRVLAAAGVCAALLLAFIGMNPGASRTWAHRMLGGNARWPQETHIRLTASVPIREHRLLMAKGEDLALTADCSGGSLPSSIQVEYRFQTGEHDVARMTRVSTAEFRYEFMQVNSPLTFRVAGGDDQSDPYEVDVQTPPAVESLALLYDFPEYTGLRDTPPDRPEADGNVRAPVGTKVSFRATVNTPLREATLALGKEGREKLSPLVLEKAIAGGSTSPAGDPRIVRGDLEVVESTEYQIRLVGANGLAGRNPVRYAIKAVIDSPPLIKVLEPGGDRRVSRVAVYPLRLTVTDDFGIRQIRLVHRIRSREGEPEKVLPFGPAHNNAPYGRTRIDGACNFDLGALGAKEGDVVEYRFEAEDDKAPEPRNVSTTKTFLFTVVPQAVLQDEKEAEFNRIKEELRAIREGEERVQTRTTQLQASYGARDALERAQRAEISSAGSDQGRLGTRMDHLVRRLEAAIRDAGYNQLLDRESEEKLAKVQAILRRLAETASPQASQALSESATTSVANARATAFARATAREQEILDGLDESLRLLEEYATYQEVIKLLQGQKKFQEEILKDLIERKKSGK